MSLVKTLSPTNNTVSSGLDYIAMSRAQAASIDVQACKTAFTCLEITNTRLNEQGLELMCDVSTRPIVPPGFRRTVFDVVHIQESKPPSKWSQTNLFGTGCGSRSVDRLKNVITSKVQKYKTTQKLH